MAVWERFLNREQVIDGGKMFSPDSASNSVDNMFRPVGHIGQSAFADLPVLAPTLANQNGGSGIPIRDVVDVHGYHYTTQYHYVKRYGLDRIAAYIAEDSGLSTGIRFLGAAESAFAALNSMPRIGNSREFRNPALSGLRMWPIPGFVKILIFYRQVGDGIEIVRVLHGARDIPSILEEDS